MEEHKVQQETKNKEDEDTYRIRKGTYDLLPNADENIKKLQVYMLPYMVVGVVIVGGYVAGHVNRCGLYNICGCGLLL